MKKTKYNLLAIGSVAFTTALLLNACVLENPDSPGWEYFPDMYRSPSVETNGVNPWNTKDSSMMGNMLPPEGTIPLGFIPFPYANTPEGDSLASKFWKRPDNIPLNDSVENVGKFLFERNCIYCHGAAGDGQGPLVTSGKYGAVPPNYVQKYNDGILTDGHIYHVITYGKGNMGSHATQLTPEERWTVIEYVQKLGRGGKSLTDYQKELNAKKTADDSLAAKNGNKLVAVKNPK
ncbi:MAG: c-type cytochrome [Bacteroidetes bacterium]|nr:c-type cytochrome [Bacteroidota bacterium]